MFAYELTPLPAWLFAAIAAALLVDAARRAHWSAPLAEHLAWALATAAVLLGHRMSVPLASGLELHYLGSAFLALLLGYPRALLSMALVLAIDTTWTQTPPLDALAIPDPESLRTAAAGSGDALSSLGLRTLLAGALPVWTMWLLVAASKRWLPRNPFVFLLGCGLFGLFIAYAVQLGASALAYLAFAPSVPRSFVEDFVPYALLLATGEAWLEAMLVTLLAVYLPGSVRLYDEAFYLRRR